MKKTCSFHSDKIAEYTVEIMIDYIWQTHLVCEECYQENKSKK